MTSAQRRRYGREVLRVYTPPELEKKLIFVFSTVNHGLKF